MSQMTLNPILGRSTEVDATPFDRDGWRIVRCRETGFVFLADPPKYEHLESDGAWEKTYEAERARRFEEEPIVSRVSSAAAKLKLRLFPKRNKMVEIALRQCRMMPARDCLSIVDVGCGGGRLLRSFGRHARAAGWQTHLRGIEISKALATQAAELLGDDNSILQADALSGANQLEPNSVDIILMSCFLEHEAKPLELLQSIKCSLRTDGVVVLKVPNFASWNRSIRGRRWCGFRYPDHVNYFTPASLRRLAREAGLMVAYQPWRERLPTSDNMYAVLRHQPKP